jgi:hypothetical protein
MGALVISSERERGTFVARRRCLSAAGAREIERNRERFHSIGNRSRPFVETGQTGALGRMFSFCRTSSIGISIQAQ